MQTIPFTDDFGVNSAQVTTAWRDLTESFRGISIPNLQPPTEIEQFEKPKGASQSTKTEIEQIAKIASVARVLIQLYIATGNPNNAISLVQLRHAILTIGLHLTVILQQRQSENFIQSSFPGAFETYRNLKSGGNFPHLELERHPVIINLSK